MRVKLNGVHFGEWDNAESYITLFDQGKPCEADKIEVWRYDVERWIAVSFNYYRDMIDRAAKPRRAIVKERQLPPGPSVAVRTLRTKPDRRGFDEKLTDDDLSFLLDCGIDLK